MEVLITKRDGRKVSFNAQRIFNAVFDAAKSIGHSNPLSLASTISDAIENSCLHPASVEDIQDTVENSLQEANELDVYEAYRRYRQVRADMRAIKLNPNAIANYITYSKYIRKGDRDWIGAVTRLKNMHITRYPSMRLEIEHAFTMVCEKMVLPSMRSIQFGGLAIEVNHARMYNCSYSPITRVEFFRDHFFLLLSGCGVGYSVQDRHISHLPSVRAPNSFQVLHHRVADSIEGWAFALHLLMTSYLTDSLSGQYVEFDYSSIRAEGQALRTSGGKAPGHIPLKKTLERIRGLMSTMVGRKMAPFEAHRICCIVALGVLAGGIRRSSNIVLFDPNDHTMLNCKTGNWHDIYPELAMSNNSAVNPTVEQTEQILTLAKQYGEPGYVRLDNPDDEGVNPCGEINMNARISKDEFGFGFCNLTEVNVSNVNTVEDFITRCRAAAFIGTLQAGYTDIKVRTTVERDALLGVSITGYADAPAWLTADILRQGAKAVVETNIQTAELLGINKAKACMTVKPSGTASLLLGGIGSGMHFHHAKRYIRRVTANENEEAFKEYRKVNPTACVQKPNGDWVIEFAMGTSGKTRGQVCAMDILNVQTSLYHNWVCGGDPCIEKHHNVSATIDVKDDEWDGLISYVSHHSGSLPPATSFMPYHGDSIYEFAPREAVTTVSSMLRWMELSETFREPDYSGVSTVDLGSACEGPSCEA